MPLRGSSTKRIWGGGFALMKKGISWLDPELHGKINSNVYENIH